ncbi:MAG: 4-hydroxy-tetrahydrodipicolinate reductase, partial [Pseudomonadota bacterium]
SATLAALDQLQRTSVNAVIIGTTGFSDAELDRVERYAERFAIVKAGNFSLGINLLEHLVQLAAARLGEAWDIEVSETHHHHKKDAPSGTALMLGEAAAKGRDKPLEALRADPYDGPEAAREPGEIGFSVQRIGGVIGDHSVSFGTQQEVITLSHRAIDRAVFAHGAIRAAQWAHSQAPGLYNLGDVLGL